MDATTMPSITSVVLKLRQDFPGLHFIIGDTFRWSPEDQTIHYSESITDAPLLLHEVAHAVLQHTDYTRDIDLIKMERDAWQLAATKLSERYEVVVDPDRVEDMLDTYRNWLHSRSTCPDCQATGLQSATNLYTCLACRTSWRVNEARSCALRRYTLHQ